MRLSITELGRIRGAEFRLAPLTVLHGPNGVGKTWVSNAIYSFGRRLSIEGRLEGYTFPPPGDRGMSPALAAAVGAAKAAIEAREGAQHNVTLDRAALSPLGPDGGHVATAGTLARWLGLPDQLAPKTSARWLADKGDLLLFERARGTITRAAGKVTLSASLEGEAFDPLPFEATLARHEAGNAVLQLAGWLRDGLFRRAVCLPEERLGVAESQASKGRDSAQDRPFLSEAARDCSRMLAELRGYGPEQRRNVGGDAELAARLSADVLGGEVEMDPVGNLSFRMGVNRLPLASSGAGVRALAMFSLYLELLASPGDLVVLDAPELALGDAAVEALCGVLSAMPERGYTLAVATRDAEVVRRLSAVPEALAWELAPRSDGSVAITG